MKHNFIFSYEKTKSCHMLLQSYSQLNTLLLKHHEAIEIKHNVNNNLHSIFFLTC